MKMTLEHKNIFVVEDDPFNIGIISMLLESHGATVKVDGWGIGTTQKLLKWSTSNELFHLSSLVYLARFTA